MSGYSFSLGASTFEGWNNNSQKGNCGLKNPQEEQRWPRDRYKILTSNLRSEHATRMALPYSLLCAEHSGARGTRVSLTGCLWFLLWMVTSIHTLRALRATPDLENRADSAQKLPGKVAVHMIVIKHVHLRFCVAIV